MAIPAATPKADKTKKAQSFSLGPQILAQRRLSCTLFLVSGIMTTSAGLYLWSFDQDVFSIIPEPHYIPTNYLHVDDLLCPFVFFPDSTNPKPISLVLY